MNDNWEYIKTFAQFPLAMGRFRHHTLTLEGARRIVHHRMAHREENFLRMARDSIYGHPNSPYLALLKLAGCELGDLRKLVRMEGLEGALGKLRDTGVYVTFEEFKGRRPIIRGSQHIPVNAMDFDNPFARRDFSLQTGGSTGHAMAVGQGLDYIAAGAPHQMLTLDAYGLLDVPAILWMCILPGNALRFILQRAAYGQPSHRWYSSTGWRDSRYWLKYALGTLYMIFWMRYFGVGIPLPRFARLDEARKVAFWIHKALKTHGRCLLYSSASRALRVSIAAQKAGLDLTGATARVGGEPLTAAKSEVIQRSGLNCLCNYGSVETGALGYSCKAPKNTDDMHFLHDSFALIQYPHPIPGSDTAVPAFNLTSLLDTAPKVMLNYQSDDFGTVEQRHCGCSLETLGYTTHISTIRSYGKLVGEAVTLIDNEMLGILEKVLPAQCGGSPLDYQLMEEEDTYGLTRLYLVIHPHIPIKDEQAVIHIMQKALRASSPAADAARTVWQQAGTIRIKRQVPVTTAHGKVLPLYRQRSHRAAE